MEVYTEWKLMSILNSYKCIYILSVSRYSEVVVNANSEGVGLLRERINRRDCRSVTSERIKS